MKVGSVLDYVTSGTTRARPARTLAAREAGLLGAQTRRDNL